jgi:hypothetical protein
MNLRWGTIFALALLGLLRPLLSILGVYESFEAPWGPLIVSALIAVVWIGVVVVQRVPNPIATLAAAGGMYGIFLILIQIVAALLGQIPEGQAPWGRILITISLMTLGWVSILITNVIWGALLGFVALVLRRLPSARGTAPSL